MSKLITRKKTKRIITVFGKRWFDKRYGNTYFSVQVYVDGKFLGYWPYEYGYGDQYLQRAQTMLVGAGVYTEAESVQGLTRMARERGDLLNYFVADVATKKDL